MGEVSLFKFLNRGPFPVRGNAVTVNASYSVDEKTQFGASFRQIIDLSDWEKSVCVLTSGQSGHFLSPAYDDQIPLWLDGKYRPMLFSKERIDAEAGSVLWLKASTRPQPHP
jgi:penicillin amidase